MIINFKQLFTWHAMLDILLIAAGLFFLYRTLRNLGTWRIVTGILIAMAVFLAAYALDLRGIAWVYRNVSHVAVIALIVIFQPELRKMLERAASMRRSGAEGQPLEAAGIIAAATWGLAGLKRGALLVFPGRDPVREWISGGHLLDAEISEPIIMSIFDPNSPGHDGALLVRGGKLHRFGVRLPISTSGKLPETLGTRHHAALGLAEKTDALVLAVSEERGRVSSFLDGGMRACADESEVAAAITSHWERTRSYPLRQYRRIWRGPAAVQLAVSLVVAAVFWSSLIVTESEILERVITVPLEYTGTPKGVVLTGEKAGEVRLHLTGPKSALDAATPQELSAKIDLSKAEQGKQTFVITHQNIRLPKGVSLLGVVPPAVELSVSRVVEQETEIIPQRVGKLPEGYEIESVVLDPLRVKVLYPAGMVEASKAVTTTPIYLEGIRQNTRLLCKIIAPPSLQPADKRWPDVAVVITVRTGDRSSRWSEGY
jgi:uncharacterized protein (TIGR00159 family)